MFHNRSPHDIPRKAGNGNRIADAHGDAIAMIGRGYVALIAAVLLVLAGCAVSDPQRGQGMKQPQAGPTTPTHGDMEVWRLDELARHDQPTVLLSNSRGIHTAMETRLLQDILATGERIVRAAGDGPKPEFVITASGTVNAFAFFNANQPTIAVSLGMVRLLAADQDAWAALFGHELAHLRLEHLRSKQDRREKAAAASSIAGMVLSVIGLPFASVAADASIALADRAYSRDDEREADRTGFEYMRRAGFSEQGALTLHERLQAANRYAPLPFLSTHPSGEERLDNLRRLMQAGDAGGARQSGPK